MQLLLGSLQLQPYDYMEQISDAGVLRLAARATVSEADLEALSRLSGPIDVVRVGISNTPRRMLLEGYVWGPGPRGLGVAVACEDEREPRVTLAGGATLAQEDVLEEVIDLLRDKTVLGEQDVQALRERIRQRRHAARHVSNVDAWSL